MTKAVATSDFAPDFRARSTADEFVTAISSGGFAGVRFELIDGEMERTTPPMSEHGRVQLDVAFALRALLAADPHLEAVGEIGIRLSDRTVVAADAANVRRADRIDRMLEPHETVLAIEVASSTIQRDLGVKRTPCAAAGVPHYWMPDVARRVIHRFAEPTEREYLALASLRFGKQVPVPGTDGTVLLD